MLASKAMPCSRLDRWPRARDADQRGVRQGRHHGFGFRRWRELIFVADDHERGHLQGGQQAGRVGPLHHAHDRIANRARRLPLDEQPHGFFGVGIVFARRRAEQLGHHLARHALGSFVLEHREHGFAGGAAFERVGAGARVGQDEGAHQTGRAPHHGKGHVAAKRQAAEHDWTAHHLAHQRFDVFGVVVDGRLGVLGSLIGRAAEAAQVGRQDAPAGEGAAKLRLPHLRAEGKRMHQHEHGLARRAGIVVQVGKRA